MLCFRNGARLTVELKRFLQGDDVVEDGVVDVSLNSVSDVGELAFLLELPIKWQGRRDDRDGGRHCKKHALILLFSQFRYRDKQISVSDIKQQRVNKVYTSESCKDNFNEMRYHWHSLDFLW
ncbi:uncharacterized protein H6S33_000407 [Morchella sextelata]|uniref:uncharacterized protein n=1 Tax=Morchella sextelata TaxID=1174677 RepID=UPI001D04A596|nr:uncharacterized protein H6S33_000407 [Morchella sextelata]KAH0614771.1 hypothetical protein H6S33_000407 [Morchella sextelata]